MKRSLLFKYLKRIQLWKCSARSCIIIGIVSLTLQLMLFILLLYNLEGHETQSQLLSSCPFSLCEDIKSLTSLGMEFGFRLINLDKHLLKQPKKNNTTQLDNACHYCLFSVPVVLGIDSGTLSEKRSKFLRRLVEKDFMPVTFYNRRPVQAIKELSQVEISLFLQRTVVIQILILHHREDNTLWYGDIHSDPLHEVKLLSLNLTIENINLQRTEGTIESFELLAANEEPYLMVPKDIDSYLIDIDKSTFIECNLTRAQVFCNRFGRNTSAEAFRFKHKVWKLLSRVKIVLESLNVVFWLSSGTALGYFRECDIIGHSKDVDIGVWASSYSDNIVSEMENHRFKLKISLGFPNDSLELSFIDQSGVKLDIFFFYEDGHSYWNGGTQVKSGRKYKYTFPKFTLCWTLLKDLRVRVPCETESYIEANYGPNWFTPIKYWDWKSSPFNVRPNGVWPPDQLAKAVKLFD